MVRSEIKIQNVICTADLKQDISIERFNDYKHLSSNLSLYRCGYVKDDAMVGRVTVFRSGKLISVGTKSPRNAKRELRTACNILCNHGFVKPKRLKPVIRNMVSSFDLNHTLSILTLARSLPKCIYEPDQFPGIIYRLQDSCVVLLFASGKGVIVGAKTIPEINSAFFDIQSRV